MVCVQQPLYLYKERTLFRILCNPSHLARLPNGKSRNRDQNDY